MAIDTRDKRTSVNDVLMPYRTAMPLADGTVDDDDRLTAGWMYSGIVLQVVAVINPGLITEAVRGALNGPFVGSIGSAQAFISELFCNRSK